jgi:hypothetical protein
MTAARIVLGSLGLSACACLGQPGPEPGGVKMLHIPLQGLFGEDFDADGVKDALQFAKRQKCSEVIFDIDSPGGRGVCAGKIAEILDQYDDSLNYHAVVTRATGAPLWILTRCDSIYVSDTAQGVTLAGEPGEPGAGGLLPAAPKQGGLPPAVARAMVIPEAVLYSWHGPDGRTEFFDASPDAGRFPGAVEEDSPVSLLSLTSARCLNLGLAGSEAAFKAKAAGWKEPSQYGAAAMRKNGEKVRSREAKLRELTAGIAEMDRLLTLARAGKPADEYTDYATMTVPDSKGRGTMTVETPEAMLLWAQRDLAYREAWFNAGKAAKDLLPGAWELHGNPDLEPGLESRLKGIVREAESKVKH